MAVTASQPVNTSNLFTLARDRSAQGRVALVEELVSLCADRAENLSDREQALMSDVLSKLISDMELTVRKVLSEKISRSETLPRELILILANDHADVAYPFLTKSCFLDDEELVAVVRNRAAEHQLAVAQRLTISETVSSALVEKGNETAITVLLRNSGAQISVATMEYLVEESKRVDSYQEPLVNRSELSRDLAKRMCMWISAALRDYLLEKFRINAAEIDGLLGETVDDIVLSVEADKKPSSKAKELAEKIHNADSLTLNLLISLLQEGEVALAISCLGRLADLDEMFVKKILFDPWGDTLAIVLKALAANKDHLILVYRLTRRANGRRNDPQELESLLDLFDSITQSVAGQMVQQWRRNPGYFTAVQKIQMGVA